ncbi:TIGR02147 family protein [Bdellovibrio sp. HCB290]|uniref:TIGR02147 family protein n=1 Tax=Bdellovibrio sp. HCB290 TaxID=3394356 RepID=UPI0039B6A1C0
MAKDFDIFTHSDTSKLLRSFIATQPQKGRGLVKQLAEHLGVASPQVSQFLSGVKTITMDQAYLIGRYFSWSELEMEYWLTIVDWERASHHEVKKHFKKKLESIKQESLKVGKAVTATTELTDSDKGQFYSSWIYSGIRLFCSIGQGKRIEEIHQAFSEFPVSDINAVVEFLLQRELLKKKGLLYEMGTQRTFVPKGSPFLKQHQTNWRLRAIERANFIADEELMFTAPLSISESGFKKVRRELQEWIKHISDNLVSYGDAEQVACLNIDFFRVDQPEKNKK